jgi:hypothetical protein
MQQTLAVVSKACYKTSSAVFMKPQRHPAAAAAAGDGVNVDIGMQTAV